MCSSWATYKSTIVSGSPERPNEDDLEGMTCSHKGMDGSLNQLPASRVTSSRTVARGVEREGGGGGSVVSWGVVMFEYEKQRATTKVK